MKKAFTLVELIVVITILSILGTIAFINLQGYSVGARDSKRVSDVNNIFKKISIERVKGLLPSNIIKSGVDIKSGLIIGGLQPTDAKQGSVDYVKIKESEDNFKDPIGSDYVYSYGIGGSGTGSYKFVQLATINESKNEAVVVGDYYKIQPTDSPSIIFTDATNTGSSFVVNGLGNLPEQSGTNNITYECNGLIGSSNPDQWGSNNGFTDFDLCNNTIVLNSLNNIPLSQNLTNNPGARDIYAFVLEGGKTYDLESLGDDENSDTAFFLYDNQGNKLVINDDMDDGVYRSHIIYTTNYTGYYYLGVMGYNDGGTYADYTLSISDITATLPVNGLCGADNGGNFTSSPINLCSTGDASSVTDNGAYKTYNWTCDGINGGVIDTCSANNVNTTQYPGCSESDISVGSYIVAACNVGATIAGTDWTNPNNVGLYFQWGNNYGSTSSGFTTSTLADATGYGPGNYYSSLSFINGSPLYRWDWTTIKNDNLWGDTTDTPLGTNIGARQGPCANGYHVPSKQEWDGIIIEGGFSSNGTIHLALKLPYSGFRFWSDGAFYDGGAGGYYWSSTPDNDTEYHMYIAPNLNFIGNNLNRPTGISVRCFKN